MTFWALGNMPGRTIDETSCAVMVKVQLKGMLPPEFSGARAPLWRFDEPSAPEYQWPSPAVEVHDARQLQSSAKSDAAFFAEHGFVLLRHETAVTDWNGDISAVYHAEISDIIRERLLPGRRVGIRQGPNVLRRGQSARFYAQGVHSDCPLTPKAYASNLRAIGSDEAGRAWHQRFASDEVTGFMLMNFWRTTNMKGPLRHMPLALCDPSSVNRSDLIPNTFAHIAPGGRLTEHLALRFNPSQRWYYYPQMTTGEVLAFKLCEYSKGAPDAAPTIVFHTAFEDPDAPGDCEPRQSCEHRAAVMVLRD